MYYLGLDVGSLTCDAVVIDDQKHILAWSVVPTGARNQQSIDRARQEVLRSAGISEPEVGSVVSTGYGRERVEGRQLAVTEITCHARGIQEVLPGTQVLVDIGGQDSKAIRLDGKGRVLDFAMNDKCAAGTGRFLEAMARALEIEVEALGSLDTQAQGNVTISSMCTVFAESEVVSRVAEGAAVAEIVFGLHQAIAVRIQALVRRVAQSLTGLRLSMSGGVAHNAGVVRALERVLSAKLQVPPQPDIVGALGAALLGLEKHKFLPSQGKP